MNKPLMFWQMDKPAKGKDMTLEQHVLVAADYHKEKYGAYPIICHVNTKVLTAKYPNWEQEPVVVNGIRLHGKRTVLPNCLHIGSVE